MPRRCNERLGASAIRGAEIRRLEESPRRLGQTDWKSLRFDEIPSSTNVWSLFAMNGEPLPMLWRIPHNV